MTHSSWWALRLSWHHQESNQPIQTGTATKHKKHVKLHVQTGKALAHTTRPAICLHSSALGHWPEPAGALVGRAGPTLATAAPAPWHLQSPLPTQRGHCCVGPCCAWAHTALRTIATPQAHAPPGNPLHCRSPSLVPLTAMTFSPFSHVSHHFQGPHECGSALSTAHHRACTATTKLSSLHYSQLIYTFKQPVVKLVKTLTPEWFQI